MFKNYIISSNLIKIRLTEIEDLEFVLRTEHDNENKNANVELMRLAILDKGKGYGKKSIRLLQQFIFENLQAHRLWLDVREHNDRAKSLYEQLGFQFEGKLRECIKTTDGYQSLIIMGLLKNEYDTLKSNF